MGNKVCICTTWMIFALVHRIMKHQCIRISESECRRQLKFCIMSSFKTINNTTGAKYVNRCRSVLSKLYVVIETC
jgi:hypothetical protein